MTRRLRRLLLPAGMWYLAGVLEGVEVLRQRRRTGRSLVTSLSDRDPASVQLLTLTWWPAGIVALAEAASLPGRNAEPKFDKALLAAGVAVTASGIALRQWAISTLGRYFVGHVVVQPGQTVVSSGPYRREHGDVRDYPADRHHLAHQRGGTRAHRRPSRLPRIHPGQTAARSARLVGVAARRAGAAFRQGRLGKLGR